MSTRDELEIEKLRAEVANLRRGTRDTAIRTYLAFVSAILAVGALLFDRCDARQARAVAENNRESEHRERMLEQRVARMTTVAGRFDELTASTTGTVEEARMDAVLFGSSVDTAVEALAEAGAAGVDTTEQTAALKDILKSLGWGDENAAPSIDVRSWRQAHILGQQWDAITEGLLSPDFNLLYCHSDAMAVEAAAVAGSDLLRAEFSLAGGHPPVNDFRRLAGAALFGMFERIESVQRTGELRCGDDASRHP